MAKRKNKGLGIGVLLGGIDSNIDKTPQEKKEIVRELSNTVAEINLNDIVVNPFQPRVDFDEKALDELSESIATHGLIQPITVRHLGDGKYELISGERRLRASKMAGLKEVPTYVRLANDQEMMEMALIENIQRQELNPIEIATTYGRLMKEFKLTHQQMAKRTGKGRSTITNYERLLNLPAKIQNALQERKISMGHAKALMGVEDIAFQIALVDRIIENKMSVRQVEELVKAKKDGTTQKNTKSKLQLPSAYQQVQDDLTSALSTKVSLKVNNAGKGQIVINFNDVEDFNRILALIETAE